MKREIFEITGKVVDASGAYNNLSFQKDGQTKTCPLSFDSHQLGDDVDKAEDRAYAFFYDCCSAGRTAKSNGRPLTVVGLNRISDGKQIEKVCIGKIPELPDPEPELPDSEEEVENGGE